MVLLQQPLVTQWLFRDLDKPIQTRTTSRKTGIAIAKPQDILGFGKPSSPATAALSSANHAAILQFSCTYP